MDARRNSLPRLLAGLQVGILGGLLILVWFLILSVWYFRAPWAIFNIVSASIRNSASWGYPFVRSTWTGLAAHLFVCGLLGMLIGWVVPRPGPTSRYSFPALVFGVIISLMVYEFFWRRYAPLIGEYISPGAILLVHFVFGMSL